MTTVDDDVDERRRGRIFAISSFEVFTIAIKVFTWCVNILNGFT